MYASFFKENCVHLEKWDFLYFFREEKGDLAPPNRENDVIEDNESS
jgi:hypothetical protein